MSNLVNLCVYWGHLQEYYWVLFAGAGRTHEAVASLKSPPQPEFHLVKAAAQGLSAQLAGSAAGWRESLL